MTKQFNNVQQSDTAFDMSRLSKSKETVDVCSNTMREYNRQGLPFYRRGKAVFFSKRELELFIREPDAFAKPARKNRVPARN